MHSGPYAKTARLREIPALALLTLALLPALFVAAVLWILPVGPLTANRTALAARDFTDMWAAGNFAARGMGDIFFDPVRFNSALRAIFGAGLPMQIWPYPPPMLLLAVPLSLLPLLPGFVIFTFSTLGLLWCALRSAGLTRTTCSLVLFSPAVADNALAGQNGALTAALFIGGLVGIDRRPVISGALLGLLVVKPQLGLLLPVCLIASRNWRALTAAAVSAGILVGLSGLFFGIDAWFGFFERTRPIATALIEARWEGLPSQRIFASPLMAARSIGVSTHLAYGVQVMVALVCTTVAWRGWRASARDSLDRAVFTGLLALAASPWAHTYDMVLLSVAIVFIYPTASWKLRTLLAYAWVWPGGAVLLPFPPAVSVVSLVAIAWLMWDRVSGAKPILGTTVRAQSLANLSRRSRDETKVQSART